MVELQTQPLKWPDWFLNASHSRRFLADFPLFGLNAMVRRYICNELVKRSYRTIELWGKSIRRVRCVGIVSPIITDCLRWPNAFFVPDDLCDMLLWDPGIELLSVEAMCKIEETLNLPANVAEPRAGMTYGMFIDNIVTQLPDNCLALHRTGPMSESAKQTNVKPPPHDELEHGG